MQNFCRFHSFITRYVAAILPSLVVLIYIAPLVVWAIHLWGILAHTQVPSYSWSIGARTATFSVVISLFACTAGGIVGLCVRLSRPQIASAVEYLTYIPLLVGFLARNYSWIGLLSIVEQKRLFGVSLAGQLLYTRSAVILVMSLVFMPLAAMLAIRGLRKVTTDQIYAAQVAGAKDSTILYTLVIRQALPSLGIAFLYIFSLSCAYFVTPKMIGGGKVDFLCAAISDYAITHGEFSKASLMAGQLVVIVGGVIIGAVVFTKAIGRMRT